MAIKPGENLLHYRLVEQIGEGGMGQVWKAVDSSLDRDVAIKVLPGEFSQDPDRLGRFEREAKTLAALNHSNIASIHGLHEAEGRRFLAMEYVDGEDLRTRLTRFGGKLPVDDAIEFAGQIADALEAAHEGGVIHRDLKPANVMVTSSEQVKVLDFGLAKAVESRAGSSSGTAPTLMPTVTSAGTAAGAILGTANYMSPEQARGKLVDRRTDVWAFGCVLYELLVGKPPFEGETATDVLAAILHKEPDYDALPAETPAQVRTLLERCLRKEAAERLRDMGDIGVLLREAPQAAPAAETAEPVAAPRKRSWLWPAAVAFLALMLVASILVRDNDLPASQGIKLTQLTNIPGQQVNPSLSPDGQQLLFVSVDGGDTDVFLQRVGGEKAINLTSDHGGIDAQPAFSPDGDRIAFYSGREGGGIFVMGATGESPRRVSDDGFDPAWSPDGTELVYTTEFIANPYSRSSTANLFVVNVASGESRRLSGFDAAGPSWSPSGQRIAFWTHLATVQGQRDLWTIPAAGGDPTPVLIDAHTDWDPFWSEDGKWLYFLSDRGGNPDLWRIAIDEQSGEAQGAPVPVTVSTSPTFEAAGSSAGVAVVASRIDNRLLRMEFDPARLEVIGTPETLYESARRVTQASVSPDDRFLAYTDSAESEQILTLDVATGERRKIVGDALRNRGPVFSPDGRWIVFYSNRSGHYDIWAVRTDGTGLRQLTDYPDVDLNQPEFLDDRRIAVAFQIPGSWQMGVLELPDGGLEAVTEPVHFQEVPESVGFLMDNVSPGRSFAAGAVATDGRIESGLYDFEQGSFFRYRTTDGDLVASVGRAGWIDDRRALLWDHSRQRVVLWEAGSETVRPLSGIPGPASYAFSRDGRTLYADVEQKRSDIWLVSWGGDE